MNDMSFSYYGELSTEVYNLTKKVGQSLDGDIEYYESRLQNCDGRILEPMVGSGRVIIPLLQSGLLVDGIDYSPEMLASCRQRCEDRGLNPNLYEADLTKLSLPHKYEAIIIPTGSFLLIENRDDSMNTLKRLYEHLQHGGKLIVDLLLPDEATELQRIYSRIETYTLPNGDTITSEQKLVQFDWLKQHLVSYITYEKWREGKLIQTERQRFALRWYGVEEFKLILESIGFTDIVISANYTYGEQPTYHKQALTYEAVKK